MATLKAMFRLMDGYSSTIDKIDRKTTQATDKILKASGQTDKFNDKLAETGDSANTAASGLSKLIGVATLLAAAKKGMDITDEFTNTSARLNMINDGLQTQAELQDKIFAAASRSRGAYSDMASAVAKLQMLAGDAFGSNDETIAFTELLQKSFKVGGADSSQQSAGMLQLSQAMASGRLQGDEFVSISENAPLILEAISKYTGKSRGELKELSSEGAITADIIKNSIFAMADDINSKFETMPMTFADIWNKIKNSALKAFQPIIEGVSKLINSDEFMNIVNVVIVGIGLLSMAIGALVGFIADNWPLIESILLAIGIYLAATLLPGFISVGIAGLIAGLQVAAAWIIANAPMIMMIAAIALLIYAFIQSGITAEDVFGTIGAIIGAAVAIIVNIFLALGELILGVIQRTINPFIVFANFLGNVFTNPVSSIIYLFQGMADNVLGVLEKIASAMDFISGSHMADTVASWRAGLKEMADDAVKKYAPEEDYKEIIDTLDLSMSDFGLERWGVEETAMKGKEAGEGAYNGLMDKLNEFKDSLTGEGKDGLDPNQFKGPLTVMGTGKNGAVDVSMEDEDLQYLRDIAEREYINKFSTATLAPNVSITFGDVHEEADADKVAGRVTKILQEQIAVAAEGVY